MLQTNQIGTCIQPHTHLYILGQYTAWQSQGCSVTCGTGIETLRRLCIRKPGDLDCVPTTPLVKQQVCYQRSCDTAKKLGPPCKKILYILLHNKICFI